LRDRHGHLSYFAIIFFFYRQEQACTHLHCTLRHVLRFYHPFGDRADGSRSKAASNFSEKVKEGTESFSEKLSEWGDSIKLHHKDDRDQERYTPMMDSIAAYIPKSVSEKDHSDFLSGDEDKGPTVFPYVFKKENGDHESIKLECFNSKFCKAEKFSVPLDHITAITFDRNYILLRKDNTLNGKNENENEPDVNYVLFNLRSLTTGSYANEKQLLKAAEQGNYRGPHELMDLEDFFDKL